MPAGLPQRMIMAKQTETKENKRRVSPLGVLLVILMLLLAAVTLAVNYFFRDGNAPTFGKYSLCYYTADEMPTVIPSGSMVIAEKADAVPKDSIVLYRTTLNTYRIAKAALTDGEGIVPDKPLTYLTVDTGAAPIQVSKSDILGICKFKSPELGVVTGFLTSPVGVLIGLILPCLVLLLYVAAAVVAAKESAELEDEDEFEDEDDTDLAFVKSIQKKQQQIAERDAERLASESGAAAKQPRRLTDEELAEMEEQEAARRAERIAQVRSHMEQRRQTETPDGVPLYTTEIITRTHTMPLPKTGELSMTRQQPAVKPGMTGQIPRKKAVTAEMQKTAVRPITKPIMTAEEAAKPSKPAAEAAEKPAEAQTAPAAPAKPAAPPATYDELMDMLDKLKQ